MKKDYIAVKKNEVQLCRNEFLKQFWASHWNNDDIKFSADSLLQDEKYIIMRQYLDNLPENARMLDGGCGLGKWVVFFANRGYKIVGTDVSWQMLIKVLKYVPSVHFISSDIRQTPFRDCYFDVYFSWGAFEHFEEGLESSITESFRIIKPRGLLFLSVPYQNWRHILRDSQRLERWDENYIHGKGYVSPMRFYQWRLRPQEVRRELEMCGFEVLKIAPIDKRHGIFRMMHHEFSWLKPMSLSYRFMSRLLLMLPSGCVAHMLMAVARKP